MELTPMPDIWQDQGAVERFQEPFFTDLAYRAGQFGGKKSRIIRSFIEGLNGYGTIDTEEEFHASLRSRLAAKPWTDHEWVRRNKGNE